MELLVVEVGRNLNLAFPTALIWIPMSSEETAVSRYSRMLVDEVLESFISTSLTSSNLTAQSLPTVRNCFRFELFFGVNGDECAA